MDRAPPASAPAPIGPPEPPGPAMPSPRLMGPAGRGKRGRRPEPPRGTTFPGEPCAGRHPHFRVPPRTSGLNRALPAGAVCTPGRVSGGLYPLACAASSWWSPQKCFPRGEVPLTLGSRVRGPGSSPARPACPRRGSLHALRAWLCRDCPPRPESRTEGFRARSGPRGPRRRPLPAESPARPPASPLPSAFLPRCEAAWCGGSGFSVLL